jgi:hypothetical protein
MGLEFYKVVTYAKDYPTTPVRLMRCQSGDTLFIRSEEKVTIGDKYKDSQFVVSEIIFKPKKWWQLWKKKRQLGYIVKLLRED